MDSDEETENFKTYTTLTNYTHPSLDDSKFNIEKLILCENSESEEEQDENFTYSDDSNGCEEEISNSENALDIWSNVPQDFSVPCEDWSEFNNSQSPDLEDLAKMNRNERFMLLQLFNKIKSFLFQVEAKMKSLTQLSKTLEFKQEVMFLGHVGAPYFKTKKDMFCSDPNTDTLDRRKRGILSIYHCGTYSKWCKNECDNLIKGVRLNYNLNKQKAVLKEITSLKRKINNEIDDEVISENEVKIKQLEQKLKNIKLIGSNDLPPLSENVLIDWDYISTEYLLDKHNAQECSSFWNIYLHPEINKSNCSKEESSAIKNLAIKYNRQNWDQIALELGTNRTGFTVFLHYTSVSSQQSIRTKFSEEEDARLLQLIDSNKIGNFIPWNTIADLFPQKSKPQIMHRYKYYLCNMEQYDSEFSDAEDVMILILVERFGRNYVKFKDYLPSKSYMQIKSRYENHLRYKRMKGSFTLKEDQKILDHYGNMNISNLAQEMNRNRMQLRQRYIKIKEFFEKHPDKSLEDMPRRTRKFGSNSHWLEFLKYSVDQFKDKVGVPSLDEIKSKLGNSKKNATKNQEIDNMLVAFFTTSYTVKPKPVQTTALKIKNSAEKMFEIFKMFGCNLKIPADMEKNKMLDIIDLEILNILRDKINSTESRPIINQLLPPNLNSLIGMRGLLLHNQLSKKSKNKETRSQDFSLISEMENILNNRDVHTQKMIMNERGIFLDRFTSMLMWPALLSIQSPNVHLLKKDSGIKNTSQSEKAKAVERGNSSNKRKIVVKSDQAPKKIKTNSQSDKQVIIPVRSSIRLKNKIQNSSENEILDKKPQEVKVAHPIIESNECTQKHINTNSRIEITDVNNANIVNHKVSKNILSVPCDNRQKIITSKLTKVDKSEIMKLVQSKQPIKIIKIQCAPKKLCPLPTGSKPLILEINERLKSLGTSKLPTLSDNLRNEDKASCNTINQNGKHQDKSFMDLDKMRSSINNSLKKNRNHSQRNDKDISKTIVRAESNKGAEDLNKLDNFLTSIEEDDGRIVNSNEKEIMQNEVDQLDQLIKQESDFDLI